MKEKFFRFTGGLAAAQGALAGWSEEFSKFYSSGYRCPKCDERLVDGIGAVSARFYGAGNRRIPVWKMAPYRAERAECPRCLYSWPVKDDSLPASSQDAAKVVGVQETERVEEHLGKDLRTIDNSRSSAAIKRRFTISKQWTRTLSVEYEQAESQNAGFSLGADGVGVESSIEESIRRKYALEESTTESYSEEVEISVPGKTHLSVIFNWKKIWQLGVVSVQIQAGQVVQIPFRVAVGLTFDQIQADSDGTG
ncbi:MAG: hypothetical protein AAF481_10740 [Acidobacteriota bacterium]